MDYLQPLSAYIAKFKHLKSITFDLGDNSELEDNTLLNIFEDFTNLTQTKILDINLRDCFSVSESSTFKRLSAKLFFFP